MCLPALAAFLLTSCAGWGDIDFRINIYDTKLSLGQTLSWSGYYKENETETDDFVFASLSFASISEDAYADAAGRNVIRDLSQEGNHYFSVEINLQPRGRDEKEKLDLIDRKVVFAPDVYCFETSVSLFGNDASWKCSASVILVSGKTRQNELISVDLDLCGYTENIYHGYYMTFK